MLKYIMPPLLIGVIAMNSFMLTWIYIRLGGVALCGGIPHLDQDFQYIYDELKFPLWLLCIGGVIMSILVMRYSKRIKLICYGAGSIPLVYFLGLLCCGMVGEYFTEHNVLGSVCTQLLWIITIWIPAILFCVPYFITKLIWRAVAAKKNAND